MKQAKLAILATLFTLSACVVDDVTERNGDGRIPITLSTETDITRASADIHVGYFAYSDELKERITANINGVDYVFQTASATGSMSVVGTTPYYPEGNTATTIKAYFPDDAGTTFAVSSDQSVDVNYRTSDLMWGYPVDASGNKLASIPKPATQNPDPVKLKFDHLMAQMKVTVTYDESISGLSEIKLNGVKNSVTFDKANGTTDTQSGTADISMAKSWANGLAAVAVIPAQTLDGEVLSVITPEGTAKYSLSSKVVKAGKMYSINISVNRLTLGTTTAITDWTETEAQDVYPIGLMQVEITYEGYKQRNYYGYAITIPSSSLKTTFAGKTLTEGTDFDYVYMNNNELGTAKVMAQGKGTYEGLYGVTTFQIGKIVDLSTKTGRYTADYGEILTGTSNYGVIIPEGATVALDGVTIQGNGCAGIECLGTTKIQLIAGSENTVTGGDGDEYWKSYAGIEIGPKRTITTIEGTGSLTATGSNHGDGAPGIGVSSKSDNKSDDYGSIVINSGNITAIGRQYGAGIGGGHCDIEPWSTMESVIINGGVITVQSETCGIGSARYTGLDLVQINGGQINVGSPTSYPDVGIGGGEDGYVKTIQITSSGDNIYVYARATGIGTFNNSSNFGGTSTEIDINCYCYLDIYVTRVGIGSYADYSVSPPISRIYFANRCETNIEGINHTSIDVGIGFSTGDSSNPSGDIVIRDNPDCLHIHDVEVGIGAADGSKCGKIDIQPTGHLEIVATNVGIGAGNNSQCGNITLDTFLCGDDIEITGEKGVAIGCGYENSSCGNIKFYKGACTYLTSNTSFIGIGYGYDSERGHDEMYSSGTSCGTIEIKFLDSGNDFIFYTKNDGYNIYENYFISRENGIELFDKNASYFKAPGILEDNQWIKEEDNTTDGTVVGITYSHN